MRFKQFLEAQVKPHSYKESDADELIEIIRENCMGAIQSARAGVFIYRGTRSSYMGGVFDPSQGERKSQNTSNYYTLLLDTNPANRGWPKRSQSFIASNRKSKAEGYAYSSKGDGTLLWLLPFDDTKIGLVNEDDLWDLRVDFGIKLAGQFGSHNIVDLNEFWEDLLGIGYAGVDEIKSMADMQALIRTIPPKNVVALLRKEGFLHNADKVSMTDAEIVDLFVDAIPKAFSYDNLGCSLTDSGDLPSESCEMWFSGKCVGINMKHWDPIRKEFDL